MRLIKQNRVVLSATLITISIVTPLVHAVDLGRGDWKQQAAYNSTALEWHLESRSPENAEQNYQACLKRGREMYQIMNDPKAKQSEFKKVSDLKSWGWTARDEPAASKEEVHRALYMLEKPMQQFGLDMTGQYVRMSHTVTTRHMLKEYPATGAKYNNIFDPKGGAVYAVSNYSPADKAPRLEAKKLPKLRHWSDVAYLELESVSTAEERKRMRYLFRTQINHAVTEGVVQQALGGHEAGDWPGHQFHSQGQTKEPFMALLGTPHGKGVVWFLSQHRGKGQLGTRMVRAITVWRTERNEGQFDPNLNFLMELGDGDDA